MQALLSGIDSFCQIAIYRTVAESGAGAIAPLAPSERGLAKTGRKTGFWLGECTFLRTTYPVAVPGVRLGGGAPALHTDPGHSLSSLTLPQAALASLPLPARIAGSICNVSACKGCAAVEYTRQKWYQHLPAKWQIVGFGCNLRR